MSEAAQYSLTDLTKRFNISEHTVYGYTKSGLMPGPLGGRRYAYYTDEHVKIIEDQLARNKFCTTKRPNPQHLNRHVPLKTQAAVWDDCQGKCSSCGVRLNPFRDFRVVKHSDANLGGYCRQCAKSAKQ